MNRIRAGRLAVPLLLLLLWWLAYEIIDDDFILASPAGTLRVAIAGIKGGWLLDGLGATMTRVLMGFTAAAVVGIWLGVTLGLRPFWFDTLEPIILAGWSAPKSILYPVFLLLFGLGHTSAAVFAASWGIFPLIAIVMNGTRRTERVYLKVGKSFRMTFLQTFQKIILPSISAELVVGLRYCFTLAFLGVVVMEMFGAREGLGPQLMAAQELSDAARMLAIILVLSVVAIVVNFGFYFAEQALMRRRGLPIVAL